MSDFHGGFYVKRVDAAVFPLVRRAMRDYLFREVKEAHKLVILLAARRGSPVLHFSVAGPAVDERGDAAFHLLHARLGADIARAARAEVFACHYENQSGSEGVTAFDATGARVADAQESWDAMAEHLGLDGPALKAALPFGRLAAQLGVERSVLDRLLPYDTPTFEAGLVGDVALEAVARYLRGAPRLPAGDPPGWRPFTVYFPRGWLIEIEALGERLGVGAGVVLHDAVQVAKGELFALPQGAEAGEADEASVAAPLSPPPLRPTVLAVPEVAPAVPDLAPDAQKVGVPVPLPEDVWAELRALGQHADRSLSWLLQRAYRSARPRLLAATAR